MKLQQEDREGRQCGASGAARLQLLPPQAEVVSQELLTSGFSCLLQMPTGSGKTFLSELAIEHVLNAGRRAVYVTPLRALAAELADRWRPRFSPHVVGVFTGDSAAANGSKPAVPFERARLLVMTPERLDLCTRDWRSHWRWLPEVDLLVADEFHLLADPRRGARLEGALLRARRLNPFLRVLALSATLGNRKELADWLGAVHFSSSWRPIPLSWRIVRYAKADEKPRLASEAVRRNRDEGGRSLVFVHSRRRAESLADGFRAEGLRALHHHAGLDRDRRQHVESTLRTGDLDVVVATPTLEMGVNLPVRQVVLYDLHQFDGARFSPMSVNAAWQRGGRAGRPGLDPAGEVVVLAPRWERDVDRYVRGTFEPIRSALDRRETLAEQVVAEVASGMSRTESQLARALGDSLAARQRVLPRVSDVVSVMTRAGMVTETCGDDSRRLLKVTPIGRVASRHLLEPETVLRFRRATDSHLEFTFFDLLVLACCTPDCEPVLPVDVEDLEDLGTRLQAEPSRLLRVTPPDLEAAFGVTGRRLLAALRMALVARDVTRGGQEVEIADAHHCYPFEVQRLRESLSRLLLAFGEIARLKAADDPEGSEVEDVPVAERVGALQRMVEAGLDEQAVTLTAVPGIGRTTARRLQLIGISDIEALAASDIEAVRAVGRVSTARAQRWCDAASDLVKTHSAFRYAEEAPTMQVTAGPRPTGTDHYRVRRSLELAVVSIEPGVYQVTGGLEPHLVRGTAGPLECDCQDAAAGNHCKHVIAVEHVRRAGHRTASEHDRSPAGALDLLALWSQPETRSGLFDLEDNAWRERAS